ncbi:peptide chain release factor PrfB3, chloroplastic isoform X2 [Ananas comosus]|uniref:Peptide chain release factor PrfB3, chloroplastic isoform X2 n=1 Tax=Ananas comosus TaxID=4615 RepID=A0A6P5EVE7_ANACO|nr:peptide chain release factor PrfB3, chloroplastic isoform X2 [Ananas comosus]
MATRPVSSPTPTKAAPLAPSRAFPRRTPRPSFTLIRASQSMESRNDRVFKELGLYSLKKKIEDAVSRAEMIAPTALELEEARRIRQEEVLHEYNLWDDLTRSNESLAALADAIKVVDDLKDLRYKAEEAKLITQLADMDIINHQLFKQAYKASLDVSKFLDRYEMSKLLNGPYDKEGACVTIQAGSEAIASEVWAEKILCMYARWAEKHGFMGRVVEKYPFKGGGVRLATIEFESEYMYGYLLGERGTHRMVCNSLDGSGVDEQRVDKTEVCRHAQPELM